MAAGSSNAAVPVDILVVGKQIDDIVAGFDPAEVSGFSDDEVCGNCYRKLVAPDPSGNGAVIPDLAERWTVSEDGLTFTFVVRKDVKFDSGNAVGADDVVFSIQRAVKLNKFLAFIYTQLGIKADNVDANVSVVDGNVQIKIPKRKAPTLVLSSLSANIASVVEKAQALAHEVDGDFGNNWLKTHTAGAGSYRLTDWKASDYIRLEANPNAEVRPNIPRLVIRHVRDAAEQLLLLQKGDIDIARNLTSDQLAKLATESGYSLESAKQLQLMYLGMNMSVPAFRSKQVREAVRYAIGYEDIANNITPNVWSVWQSYLPGGLQGAIKDLPFKKDVEKAKSLMADAGFADGFSVTLDHFSTSPHREIAQALQSDLSAIGIQVQLLPGEENQVISKIRSRQQQMALHIWFSDYPDPDANSQTYCSNKDNSDNTTAKTLAWRYNFVDEQMTTQVEEAAAELDATKRFAIYGDLQREAMDRAPYAVLLQKSEVACLREGVSGLHLGLVPAHTRYAGVAKA
ncbi:MAG: ABC transporter substrate-binding protein [Mesorhizobium sp.]|nr:MAG: ABC transporter substrate-binding protein [Mesorhizobium sp.]